MSKAGDLLRKYRDLVESEGDEIPTIRVVLTDLGDGTANQRNRPNS